jgi:hypothetical protein
MTKRQKTLVCAFDLQSPRITAFDIHEWIHDTMRLQETEVAMVQVDGPRHIYIKFRDSHRIQETLTLRLLMSHTHIYIYMERLFLMFLDHTTQHSR